MFPAAASRCISSGAKMVKMYGTGPVFDGMGLINTIYSYVDEIAISFTSDRNMMPDPDAYAAALTESFEDLKAAVLTPALAKPAGETQKSQGEGMMAKDNNKQTEREEEHARKRDRRGQARGRRHSRCGVERGAERGLAQRQGDRSCRGKCPRGIPRTACRRWFDIGAGRRQGADRLRQGTGCPVDDAGARDWRDDRPIRSQRGRGLAAEEPNRLRSGWPSRCPVAARRRTPSARKMPATYQ